MRKIAEKLNRIGKAKIEKDGKSEEYIVFSSGLLPCDEEIHKETLEHDLRISPRILPYLYGR